MLNAILNVPRRAKRAMGFSLRGIWSAFRKEEAIKLEFIALVILAAVMALVEWPLWKKLALTIAYLGVPAAELLNSAIEDVCDLVSPEFNEKVRDAKDKGSAAVLVAIVVGLLALATLLAIP
jgi:diacylglycerol kinase (ATP)